MRLLVKALQCQKRDAWLQFRRPQLPAEVPGTGRAEVRDVGQHHLAPLMISKAKW